MSLNKVGPANAHRLQVSLKGGHHNARGTPTDYKNFYLNIKLYIGDQDSQLVVDKFQARADHLPDFTFNYNIVDGELRALFWADETAKINYQAVGDVLAFDATYHMNKYNMIFVPFTGVDSHKRCVMFGAGLLYNETIESYCCLLDCFIKPMGNIQC
ncbi:protein FAR1-RELATED SEQUENCE 5-like [Bidens hawaiensis]|uniref:protein FAR1-RELATED SEQUENCE 5-like n=1 Tax=Bidens hawaiensis TaxID=980011 RepID=UPI0040496EAF